MMRWYVLMKMRNKRKFLYIAGLILIVAAALGIGLFFWFRGSRGGEKRQMNGMPDMSQMGENVISASGLTSVGMSEETLEFDFLETALYVEESYLSTGDEVEAGTVVFEVSEETLTEARKELQDKVTETSLKYRQGLIDYEEDHADAQITYQTADINKKYAQAEYDSAISKAAAEVTELTEQVEEARELVEEYEKSINEDYYRTYYQVDELYQTYYEHFVLLMEKYEEWNIAELESSSRESGASVNDSMGSSSTSGSNSAKTGTVEATIKLAAGSSDTGAAMKLVTGGNGVVNNRVLTTGNSRQGAGWIMMFANESGSENGSGSEGSGTGTTEGGNSSSQGKPSGTFGGMMTQEGSSGDRDVMGESGNGMQSAVSEASQKLSVYEMLDELVQQEAQEYQEALENYETARDMAAAGIDEARSNLEILESELTQAQTEYEKSLISCQADYDTTLAESENAQTVYDTTVEGLVETLDALLQDKEEAEENLALFEEVLGDGKFYTSKDGTIVINAVRKGSYLSGATLVIAYSNPETVNVTANVDQGDIAQLTVGEEAFVVISEYGSYEGTITEINPVTQAESRSSVTYQVTVTLTGDISALESNLTAYVYFGAELPEESQKPERGEMPDGMEQPEGGAVPEGMEMPQSGDMPEGMEMPQRGEMSEGMEMPDNGSRKGGKEGAGNEGEMD